MVQTDTRCRNGFPHRGHHGGRGSTGRRRRRCGSRRRHRSRRRGRARSPPPTPFRSTRARSWCARNGRTSTGCGSSPARPNINTPPVGQTLPEGVLVPYPIESGAVGHPAARGLHVLPRTFTVPSTWNGRRVHAELRRGHLGDAGVGERHAGRHAHRRLRRVLVRHHQRAAGRQQRDHRRRVLPRRRQPVPDRQATPQPERHLVHGGVGHLADGVAGTGGRQPHHAAGHDPGRRGRRARPGRAGHGRTAGPGRGADRRHGRRRGNRHGRCTPADPGAERAAVVAERPVPVRPAGDAWAPTR